MPTIFISRDLKAGSPLQQWATETGWEVIGRSLITFAPVNFDPPAPAESDWWFFYSPRAVEFSADQLVSRIKEVGNTLKLGVIGPGTARALRELPAKPEPDFVGEGSPAEVAQAFGKAAAGQRVFFPRARQSRLTVQTILREIITVQDAICYDNVAVPVTEPVPADIYVFTSPLNVAAYLGHQSLRHGARIIAIGPSTGSALTERGLDHEMTEHPGEEWVVAMLT